MRLIGLLLAVAALYRARTAQGATAWILLLIAFPTIGIILFLVFGSRSFQGYINKRSRADESLAQVWEAIDAVIKKCKSFPETSNPHHSGASHLHYDCRVWEKIAASKFVQIETAELLINGNATFTAMKQSISLAKRSIFFQFYVLKADRIGEEILQVLEQKAREGVVVRLLYDGIGSRGFSRARIRRLKEAGVRTAPFQSTKFVKIRSPLQINFRNHRKLIVIDGRETFVGGINIGDEYLSRDKQIGKWRDTHLKLTGITAWQAARSFIADWHWSTGETIPLRDLGEPSCGEIGTGDSEATTERNTNVSENENTQSNRGVTALVLATGPLGIRESGALAVIHAINSAKRRIWLASPYFVPDLRLIAALQIAALRGVDVRVLITRKTDNIFTRAAAFAIFPEILSRGVRVFDYRQGFMHQKVFLRDDDTAYIGSANLDERSFRLNFEIGGIIIQEEFAKSVEQMLINDFANSSEILRSQFAKRSLAQNLFSRIARLFSPVL